MLGVSGFSFDVGSDATNAFKQFEEWEHVASEQTGGLEIAQTLIPIVTSK